MAEVKLGGVWLHSLGHVSGVKWSDRHGVGPCGPDLASCSVAVDSANDVALLRLGRTFEVWNDGVKVFGGRISEMGRGFPRELHAKGWPHYVAAPGTPNTSWGRDVNNVAYTPTGPTAPTWLLDASDLDIGVADDSLYTRVEATYVSAVSGDPPQPSATSVVTVDDTAAQEFYGVLTFEMDLQPLGLISEATALAYAQQQLNLFGVPQWLSRVTTNSGRLLTPGGHGAKLADVRAGQMVRLFNVPNNFGGLRNQLAQDVVLGEVEHDVNSPAEVTIAPARLAVRNLADAIGAAVREREAA